MEADSTTHEKNPKSLSDELNYAVPFSTCPGNFKLYKEFIADHGDKILESQIVERLQNFGLLLNLMKCPTNKPDCKVTCRPARVVDRVQWVCEGCGKRMPIRERSFFFRLQCSIMQTLQIILAWCEDADYIVAAEHFGVKPKVATLIYDKLDEVAIKEYNKHRLGGENSVVLAEMYPDCMNRLSPDTTEQSHVHRILMLADTNHIPTFYRLHVIKDDIRKGNTSLIDNEQILKSHLEEIISNSIAPGSMLVTGNNMPPIDGASSIQQLTQHCDNDMEHFLSTRIWRQASSLCSASRDVCARGATAACGASRGAVAACGASRGAVAACGASRGPAAACGASRGPAAACGAAVQRYLHAALYRLRFGDGFYKHMLTKVADDYTRTDREVSSLTKEL